MSRFEIPGYREAVKREMDIRDAAFLNITADICGIPIRQMTPRDYLILDGLGSPILDGRIATASREDIVKFLWFLSPEYRHGSWWRSWVFGFQARGIPVFLARLKL